MIFVIFSFFYVCVSMYAYSCMGIWIWWLFSVCEWTNEQRWAIQERDLPCSFSFLLTYVWHLHVYVCDPFLSHIHPSSTSSCPLASPACLLPYPVYIWLLCGFLVFSFALGLNQLNWDHLWTCGYGVIHCFMVNSPLSLPLRRMTSSSTWSLTTIWSTEWDRLLWFLTHQWLKV